MGNAQEGGEIDPFGFTDSDSTRYLLYKNDGNSIGEPDAIWLQPVAHDGITLTGPRVELLHNDRPDEAGVTEAPDLIRRDGRYILFYSAGSYAGAGYHSGYATSSSLEGPYLKSADPLMTTATFGGQVTGPGGEDVVQGTDGDHIFFHGWLNGGTAGPAS